MLSLGVSGLTWFALVDVHCKQYFDIWEIIQMKENQAFTVLKGKKSKC